MKALQYSITGSLLACITNGAFAGGLDNGDRNFNIIYEKGSVIELAYGETHAPLQGSITQRKSINSDNQVQTGHYIGDRYRPSVAMRFQLTDNLGCAAKYEQPFSANIAYQDDQLAYENGGPLNTPGPLAARFESESLTVACSYDFNLESGMLTVFAGPKVQTIEGGMSSDLTTQTLGAMDDTRSDLKGDAEVGYVAGMAFSIPDIALRASVLYQSQIDYNFDGDLYVYLPLSNVGVGPDEAFTFNATSKTFTPQTLELALRSGIAKDTLAFVSARWSEWGKLKDIQVSSDYENYQTSGGINLGVLNASLGGAIDLMANPTYDMFYHDTVDYKLGIGHKLTERITLATAFSSKVKLGSKDDRIPEGYDSKSVRFPSGHSRTLTLGGSYQFNQNVQLKAGLAYTVINGWDTQTASGNFEGDYKRTEATSYQMGLKYRFN